MVVPLGMLRTMDAVWTPMTARIVVRMNQMGTTPQTGGFLSKKSIPKPQKSIWKSRREKKRGERALSRLTPDPRRFN